MAFQAGDAVHVALFGKGIVREVRNGARYLVEVKGTHMVASASQLTPLEPARHRKAPPPAPTMPPVPERRHAATSIDLHGRTVAEADALVDAFLNDAMLAGLDEVRIVHGISGGRVKAAAHARLRALPTVRGFRVDPSNAGVTIVTL